MANPHPRNSAMCSRHNCPFPACRNAHHPRCEGRIACNGTNESVGIVEIDGRPTPICLDCSKVMAKAAVSFVMTPTSIADEDDKAIDRMLALVEEDEDEI